MTLVADTLNSLVPITQFNKGQASRIFDRLKTERRLIVLKNNAPSAVILSLEEYTRMAEAEEDMHLLQLAQERIEENEGLLNTLSEAEVMVSLGITEEAIEQAADLEIE
jgi:PHD/YefM family antitoxin component YafN of YafNO toxin-antitoxin module